MLVYNYHPVTKEFTGFSEADEDPLDKGKWLIPASATVIPPPEPADGKYRAFIDGSWALINIPSDPIVVADIQPIVIEEAEEQRRGKEIISLLEAIDVKSIRPLRAIASGSASTEDVEALGNLDAQAQSLREELAKILAPTEQR